MIKAKLITRCGCSKIIKEAAGVCIIRIIMGPPTSIQSLNRRPFGDTIPAIEERAFNYLGKTETINDELYYIYEEGK